MVRFIVGTVIAAGLGKINTEDVSRAIRSGVWDEDARKYIMCAPAHGLVLKDVDYGNDFKMSWERSSL